MTNLRILVIDDRWGRNSDDQHEFVSRAKTLSSSALTVTLDFITSQHHLGNELVNDANIAVELIAENPKRWALVLLDMQFDYGALDAGGEPAFSDPAYGLNIEKALLDRFPDLPLIRFTSTHEKDLDAVQRPYISKIDDVSIALRLALVDHGAASIEQKSRLLQIPSDTVVRSEKTLGIYADAFRFSQSESPILIRGESGTGKEHLARYIHSISHHAPKPFVAISVANIPTELFESTLFGHVKGAFTGAAAQDGLFTQAGDGTAFLDEIGAATIAHQAKMLRVLQERKYRKVGGHVDLVASCKIVAATQDDIEYATRQGDFRADLYNRFGQKLALPPLRDRREEILPLAQAFLASTQDRYKKSGIVISTDAISALETDPLLKNARSVESAIEFAVSRVSSNGVIYRDDLGLARGISGASVSQVKNEQDTNPPSVVPGERILPTRPQLEADSLLNILEALKTYPLDPYAPEFRGMLQEVDATIGHLRQEMAYMALSRCRDQVKGKIKIQPAMQLLTGDNNLSATNAKRVLNTLLGKAQTAPIDLDELILELRARSLTP